VHTECSHPLHVDAADRVEQTGPGYGGDLIAEAQEIR
jgi:hypothetical protein